MNDTLYDDLDEAETPGLEGEVTRITFRSDDGYTVFALQCEDRSVTCVGHFARLAVGDEVRLKGDWVVHPRYGKQCNVTGYEVVPPHTEEGLVRYLSSGLIPGVGKSIAERIVRRFGADTLEIIVKGVMERRTGIYNLAGSGTVLLRDIARELGKPYLPIPAGAVKSSLAVLRRAGVSKYGPEQVSFLRYRPVLSNRRLVEEFGYEPRFTSLEALRAWRASRG